MAVRVSRSKDGRYYKNVGKLCNGNQPKFYLGRDEADATVRAVHLDKYWRELKKLSEEYGESPIWSEYSTQAARAIAAGEREVTIDFQEDCESVARLIIYHEQAAYPLRIKNLDAKAQKDGEQCLRQMADELEEEANQLREEGGSERFHEVADAYCADVAANKRTESGKVVSDWGQTLIRQVTTCKRLFGNPRLTDWDTGGLDNLITLLRNRPIAESTGRPYSTKTLDSFNKALKLCLKWANRNNNFFWQLPPNYEFPALKLKLGEEEDRNRGPQRIPAYETEEVRLLYQHANPWQRLITLLGLNCGFGQMEVATLRKDEVFLHQVHPDAKEFQLDSDGSDSWIIRMRVKTRVWCHWKLWPETVNALQWHQNRWPKSEHEEWVLNSDGNPLRQEGKRNTAIANSWTRLNTNICEQHLDFTKRSFNKLRKTSANQVRIPSGSEISSLFLSHGRPVAQDRCLENYTNPEYRRLFDAIDALREVYKNIFDCVENPFPEAEE